MTIELLSRLTQMEGQQTDQLYALVDMGRYGLTNLPPLPAYSSSPKRSQHNKPPHVYSVMTDLWYQQWHPVLNIFLSLSNYPFTTSSLPVSPWRIPL